MSAQKGRIVVIDDEPVICSGVRMALSDSGHAVTVCRNGREGRQALEENDFDVALLDVRLPDDDGMEILSTIQQAACGPEVIVMTGYASVEDAVAAMKQGALNYIAKPFTDEQLIREVDQAVEHRRLKAENRALRLQFGESGDFSNIVGKNSQMVTLFDQIRKAAPTESTVLVLGESGTGKELFARAIHTHSLRSNWPFIPVDCSTFSSSLLESELFGHVKGAFTGAHASKAGIFEMARGGTLFLDEIASLGPGTQSKLLRVLESREYRPVGAERARKADIRIIAASNQDLQGLVADGKFRQDLYYRLNVLPLYIPPLRRRKDDIPRLLYHFLKLYRRKTGKRIDGFSDEALKVLMDYKWPGNVRQLKNVVERLVVMTDARVLDAIILNHHWGDSGERPIRAVPETLAELRAIKQRWLQDEFGAIEMQFLRRALAAEAGNITRAAKRVGMQRSNFSTLMKKHGVKPDGGSENSRPADPAPDSTDGRQGRMGVDAGV
jgi:two-component system NtrC family response regulator